MRVLPAQADNGIIIFGDDMKITFIADTHYYSKTLGTSGKAYELRSGSDQKCLAETAEIIDAAFEKIAAR